MKKKILILCSDPESINYEIIKKSLFFFKKKTKNNYIFIGCKNDISKFIDLKKNKLSFIHIKKNKNIKKYLQKCFLKSFEILQSKKANGLINLPLSKKFLPYKYNGFTEYISDFFKRKNKTTMILYNNKFSVCPNTTHIPIKSISNKLSKKIIENNVLNIYKFYKSILNKKKIKIGIMGLNPHNGIDFRYNTEENRIIKPAIKSKKIKHIKVFGPISPDVAFNIIDKKKINCLIGNYHDQVLPTFKYINKFSAINITLGLPFLRISPDHGTAKDIIKKKIANPESFLYALNFLEKNYKRI